MFYKQRPFTWLDKRSIDKCTYKMVDCTWANCIWHSCSLFTDQDLQVQVIWSSTGPKLICHSSCLTDRSSFLWYKNGTMIQGETSPSYGGHVDPADSYSCSYQRYRSTPVCEFTLLFHKHVKRWKLYSSYNQYFLQKQWCTWVLSCDMICISC